MTKAEEERADALELEVLAREACMKAGENPDEERWRLYLEQARAMREVKKLPRE